MTKKEKDISKKNTVLKSSEESILSENKRNKDILGKYICFSGEKDSRTILLNPENTYFKITKIEIHPILKDSISGWFGNPITISCKINISDSTYRTKIIHELDNHSFQHYNKAIDLNEVINNGELALNIEFDYTCDKHFECDVYIHYTTIDKRVDLKNPYEEFLNHIKQKDNVKVLFSGPFGQGKTTFLGDFFEKNNINYEVFKLFPVNYAVSHNEDIFKFIKAEILFQLMSKDVEFDKEKFSYLQTAPTFFKKNTHNILSTFIGLLPAIGKSAADIYEKLYELGVEYFDYHSKLQIDDKAKAIEFIHELYEKEGSIFEDNFFTQLIRQLLQQHKEKHKKENVLIIDDIDRMDPDHIFRIFNVFSANFDSNEYRVGLSNKFGFDKIILVCDYSNIKKLFSHRYGNNYSFDGYLSKYYSRNPYHYDNIKAIESIVKEVIYYDGTPIESVIGNALKLIISDLIYVQEITLRDLLKLQKQDFYKTLRNQTTNYDTSLQDFRSKYMYLTIITFLNYIYDSDAIIAKFKVCKHKAQKRQNINYTYFTSIGFIPFMNGVINSTFLYTYMLKNFDYNFKIRYCSEHNLNIDYYHTEDLKMTNREIPVEFFVKDFYEILIQNAEKYNEL